MVIKQQLVGGWTNPFEKCLVKLGIFPIWRVKIKKSLETTTKPQDAGHPFMQSILPLPPCLGFLEGWGFKQPGYWHEGKTWFLSMKKGSQISICFAKSSYSESYFVVVLLFFPGKTRRANILVDVTVCIVDGWNKIKNKKDSQRMHRKKECIAVYSVCGDEYYQKLSNSNPSMVKLWKKVLISFAAFCSSFHIAAAVAKSKAIQDFSIFQNLCRFLTHPHK